MNQEKIGKFIAKLRKERKLTQEELAEKLHVSNKTISRWETGKCMPDISLLIPLSEILKITINELITGEYIEEVNLKQKSEEALKETIKYSKNKIKKEKQKYIWIVVLVIIITGFILGIIDHSRIKMGENPLFMVRITTSDKSIQHYIGLGYRAERQIGVSYKQEFKDSNYVNFGPWIYVWRVDILDVKPVTLYAQNENGNTVVSNIGSYCWYKTDGIYKNGACIDTISPLEMKYENILKVNSKEKILLKRFNGEIKNISIYESPKNENILDDNSYLVNENIAHKNREFKIPNLKGEYIIVISIEEPELSITHSIKIKVE